MNVLLLGSGGREHALAWKISKSPKCSKLFVSPGNAGTEKFVINIDIDQNNFENIYAFILEQNINLVVCGPEGPLSLGLADFLEKKCPDVLFLGPHKDGAQLESSKEFGKKFMLKYNIPTAKYQSFDKNSLEDGYRFLETLSPPFVLKADGLCAGKGVIISPELEDAKYNLKSMIAGQMFGNASNKVIIEEFLDGVEFSSFILTDGKDYLLLPFAKDYKKLLENDKGPNTGGMGAVSPVSCLDQSFIEKVIKKIIEPTVNGINQEGFSFKGLVFFGLIKVNDEPYVIEYNTRLGDPETQAILPRIESDILDLFIATCQSDLKGKTTTISSMTAATLSLISHGYPGKYEVDKYISIPNDLDPENIIFHAGTKTDSKGCLKTAGGRVLNLSALGKDLSDALKRIYHTAEKVSFEGKGLRKDIGQDIIKLKNIDM